MEPKYKEIEIGGSRYTIRMFTPTKALKVLTRLTKLVGEPLAQAANGMDKDLAEVLPRIVHTLIERLDEQEVERLIKEDLIDAVLFEGVPVKQIFDLHFQGRIGDLFKVLIEVVKYNYQDFFKGLAAATGKLAGPKLESVSPTTSAGPSGESSRPKLRPSQK